MKDISISHIVTERNVKILPCGGPQDPEYQKNDTWVSFLKFPDPRGAKWQLFSLSLCAKLKNLSFKTGPVKKY